jgi:hypothetical protein
MSSQSVPEALPVLSAGGHLRLEDGACLMEYVSVLAGERFSDRPACTDPTLAAVARIVNDELSDEGRQPLAARAVTLIGRTGDRGRLAPAIVAACLAAALDRLDRPVPALERQLRRATRRLAAGRQPGARPRRPALAALYARGPAEHAIGTAALALRRLPAGRRDPALRAMLDAAIEAATRASAGQTVRAPSDAPVGTGEPSADPGVDQRRR